MKNMQTLSDHQLVQMFMSDGNEQAFGEIYKRYSSKVAQRARVLIKQSGIRACEDHNDLTSETFAKIQRALKNGNYKNQGKFEGWIFSILKRAFIDLCRRNKRQPTVGLENWYFNFNFLPDIEKRMLVEKIREVLETSKDYSFLFLYLDGMEYSQISRIFGVSENSVRSRVFREKHALREVFREEMDEIITITA